MNFQTPPDFEFEALKALLQVPSGEDGRLLKSVIVTTACACNVRGVDYDTFWLRTPRCGGSDRDRRALPDPIYFNEQVIPDSKPHRDLDRRRNHLASGRNRHLHDPPHLSPTAGFATFTATCAPAGNQREPAVGCLRAGFGAGEEWTGLNSRPGAGWERSRPQLDVVQPVVDSGTTSLPSGMTRAGESRD